MVNNLNDLKDLVAWMKKERVASFRIGETEIHFAPAAFLSDLSVPVEAPMTDEQRKAREEDDLYYSAG